MESLAINSIVEFARIKKISWMTAKPTLYQILIRQIIAVANLEIKQFEFIIRRNLLTGK